MTPIGVRFICIVLIIGISFSLSFTRVHRSSTAHHPALVHICNPTTRYLAMSSSPLSPAAVVSNPDADGVMKKYTNVGYITTQILAGIISLFALLSTAITTNSWSFPALSSGYYSIAFGYFSLTSVGHILQNANKRNRLDGNTFKILNLALLIACVTTAVVLKTVLSTALLVVCASVCIPTLSKYGPPKFKIQTKDYLTVGLMISVMATSLQLAIANVPGIYVAGKIISLGMLISLHGAALVGPTRLASATYQALAKVVITESVLSIAAAPRSLDVFDLIKIICAAQIVKGFKGSAVVTASATATTDKNT